MQPKTGKEIFLQCWSNKGENRSLWLFLILSHEKYNSAVSPQNGAIMQKFVIFLLITFLPKLLEILLFLELLCELEYTEIF